LCNIFTLENEREILTQIGKGNQNAFESLFRFYYTALSRFAFTYLKDADDAEEVVQDVFIKLWESRSKIETIQSVKSYLYRSVSNRCLNNIKHEKIKQIHRSEVINTTGHTFDTGVNTLEKKDLEKSIQIALETLPTQCRKVFELSRFQELSYKEIAEVLDISVKTVENHIGKALKIMRKELSDYLMIVLVIFTMHSFSCCLVGVNVFSVVKLIIAL